MTPDAIASEPEKGMDITEDELMILSYRLEGLHKKLTYDLNKCVGCDACVKVCPVHAITLGPVVEIAQGLLEGTPAVIIDHDECCYCGLCKFACPTGALDIEVDPPDKINWEEYPRLMPFAVVDPDKCQEDPTAEICQKCVQARKGNNVVILFDLLKECPHEALSLTSPFEGTVKIYKNLLYKCDPNGCKACVNVCPTESFFIPQKADEIVKYGKIAVNEDNCIHCGACELACPEDIIEVKRDRIRLDERVTGKAWTRAWESLYGHLLTEKTVCPFCKEQEKLPEIEEEESELGDEDELARADEERDFTPPEEKLAANAEKLAKIREFLAQIKVRYQMERGNKEKVHALFRREAQSGEAQQA